MKPPISMPSGQGQTPTFSPVSDGDAVGEVVRLAREIWQGHFVPIIGQAQVDYMLDRIQGREAVTEQIAKGFAYYLIRDGDRNVGYFALAPVSEKGRVQLSKLYVLASCRGRGFGKAALRFVERLGRDRSASVLWLTVNKDNIQAIRWYERMGFVRCGELVQDIGGGFVMDDFKMEKPLAEGESSGR